MAVDPRPTRPRPILQPGQPLGLEPTPPQPDLMLIDPNLGRDLTQRHTLGAASTTRARFTARCVLVCARTRRCNSARSSSEISNTGTVNIVASLDIEIRHHQITRE